jgi:hypothetical protein
MKLRSTLLAFALLLMMGPLASAGAPGATAAGDPALMTPAAESPGCAAATLPFLNPSPTPMAGAPCGLCSEAVCQGGTTGTYCGVRNGQYARCQAVYGDTCGGGTLTWNCSCWAGPLP